MPLPLIAGLGLLGLLGGGQFAFDQYKGNRRAEERIRQQDVFANAGLLDPLTEEEPTPGLMALFAEDPSLVKDYTSIGQFNRGVTADNRAFDEANTLRDDALAAQKQAFTEQASNREFKLKQDELFATQARTQSIFDYTAGENAVQNSYDNPVQFDAAVTERFGRKAEPGYEWSKRGKSFGRLDSNGNLTFVANDKLQQAAIPGFKAHNDIVTDVNAFNEAAAAIDEVNEILGIVPGSSASINTEYFGESSGALSGLAAKLQLTEKQVLALGAFDEGSKAILQQIIPDFTDFWSQLWAGKTSALGAWNVYRKSAAAKQSAHAQQFSHVRNLPAYVPIPGGATLLEGDTEVRK